MCARLASVALGRLRLAWYAHQARTRLADKSPAPPVRQAKPAPTRRWRRRRLARLARTARAARRHARRAQPASLARSLTLQLSKRALPATTRWEASRRACRARPASTA